MTRPRANILFTSAGRRVELVHAFRRACEALNVHSTLAATDIDPLAPALQEVDVPCIVPRTDEPGFIPALQRIIREHDIDLVFPLTDPDIPVLSHNLEHLQDAGAAVVVCPPHAVAKTVDKWNTAAFFQEIGLPSPRTWLPGELDPGRAEYPLFIKPRQGSAARGTFKVRDARELEFFLDYVADRAGEPVVQEFLDGPEITSDVVCSLDGELLGVACRKRLEVRWGEVAKGVTVEAPEVVAGCAQVAKALPAVGTITVQSILVDGAPHFTEINARFGGGMPLGIAAGVDAPAWLLARHLGLDVEVPPLGACAAGLYMTRYDQSHFLNEDARERTASRDFRS